MLVSDDMMDDAFTPVTRLLETGSDSDNVDSGRVSRQLAASAAATDAAAAASISNSNVKTLPTDSVIRLGSNVSPERRSTDSLHQLSVYVFAALFCSSNNSLPALHCVVTYPKSSVV